MKSYRIKGICLMEFFIDVDQEVVAETEEEAIQKVQDNISVIQAYDQSCVWAESGPDVSVEDL